MCPSLFKFSNYFGRNKNPVFGRPMCTLKVILCGRTFLPPRGHSFGVHRVDFQWAFREPMALFIGSDRVTH